MTQCLYFYRILLLMTIISLIYVLFQSFGAFFQSFGNKMRKVESLNIYMNQSFGTHLCTTVPIGLSHRTDELGPIKRASECLSTHPMPSGNYSTLGAPSSRSTPKHSKVPAHYANNQNQYRCDNSNEYDRLPLHSILFLYCNFRLKLPSPILLLVLNMVWGAILRPIQASKAN